MKRPLPASASALSAWVQSSSRKPCGVQRRAPGVVESRTKSSEAPLQPRQVYAALGLGVSRPAAAARILARLYRLRAGEATDREIAIGDQRIFAQRMRAHVVGLVRRRPMRKRIDADARADRLEDRKC